MNLRRLIMSRFHSYGLPYKLNISNVQYPNYNDSEYLQNKQASKYPTALVFHKIRDSINNDSILTSISENGFYTDGCNGNKGSGLYCSSHSNYPLLWGCGSTILCEVITDPRYIKAYRSEIPPGQEYRVLDKNFIKPIVYMDISVKFQEKCQLPCIYYEHGLSGCISCDQNKKGAIAKFP